MTSHDTAGHCRHRAANKCLAGGKDSETQLEPFYEFERRKELDGGAMAEECYYAMEKRLSAIQGVSDDANVIFGGANARMLRIGHRARLHRNYTNITTHSEFLLPRCQSTYDLSLHGVHLSTQGHTY